MDCLILLYFLYLASFAVSTYVIFIWVYWILMAYASSTTYLLTRLPHAGLYNYDLRQIELFHLKWFNCEYMSRVWVNVFVKWLRLVLVHRRSYKFNNNLRTSKQTKIYHKSNVFNVAYSVSLCNVSRIVYLFNPKLNDSQNKVNVQGELANKTGNRTVSHKHRKGRTLVQIK